MLDIWRLASSKDSHAERNGKKPVKPLKHGCEIYVDVLIVITVKLRAVIAQSIKHR